MADNNTVISLQRKIKEYLEKLGEAIYTDGDAAASPNALLSGGKYNSAPPTLSDGDITALQVDANGMNIQTKHYVEFIKAKYNDNRK